MKIAQSSCKMKAIWAILVILVIGALVTCLSIPLAARGTMALQRYPGEGLSAAR
jgi:hypothetical protein